MSHAEFFHLLEDLGFRFPVRPVFGASSFPGCVMRHLLILLQVRHVFRQEQADSDQADCRKSEQAPQERVQGKLLQVYIGDRHGHNMHKQDRNEMDRVLKGKIDAVLYQLRDRSLKRRHSADIQRLRRAAAGGGHPQKDPRRDTGQDRRGLGGHR